ncbi:MAG: hypothetical protein DMD83_09450 [Candidatus Rokuibacteriota bacterium]|nr:MAG: hypothetical protein DMD83_09450 [Candidatus Rokubacteria bacterium]
MGPALGVRHRRRRAARRPRPSPRAGDHRRRRPGEVHSLHPDDHAFTINGLAVRPGRVIMSQTSGHTLDRLAKEGIEVLSLDFDAVYRGGGIHCSTAPLVRDPV